MIKITNGVITVMVTQGAYDSFFSTQGYTVLSTNECDTDIEWEEENDEEN